MRHVYEEPVASDGKAGQHRWARAGAELVEMRVEDVPGGKKLEGGHGDPEGVRAKVFHHHGGHTRTTAPLFPRSGRSGMWCGAHLGLCVCCARAAGWAGFRCDDMTTRQRWMTGE